MTTNTTTQANTAISGPGIDPSTGKIDPHAVTISGLALDTSYTPDDLPVSLQNFQRDINNPGEFPYTRGLFPQGYRTRLWTMRQFAGFGSADDTNQRFKYILNAGKTKTKTKANTGLSTAFDLPTLMGRDSDDVTLPRRGRQVRRRHRHHRGHAPPLRGHPHRPGHRLPDHQRARLRHLGHVPRHGQATRHRMGHPRRHTPERHPQRVPRTERVHLPARSLHQTRRRHHRVPVQAPVPKWNSVSISGYHIREAGSSATQELAFTLRDGMEYVEACLIRGLDIEAVRPPASPSSSTPTTSSSRRSPKLRAARRIWARMMKRPLRRPERTQHGS